MTQQFFEDPILNSPYERPARHWELSKTGQPTNIIIDQRRRSDLVAERPGQLLQEPRDRPGRHARRLGQGKNRHNQLSCIQAPGLDAYNREGSTRHINFITSKPRFETQPDKCHINYCVLDSDWEGEFCRVVEKHPKVLAYVKNHAMGFEVPYSFMGEVRRYRPDFIVNLDDGKGADDPLHLVVEVKGYRGEDAKEKAATMETFWVPGVNSLSGHGRWAFAEFTNVWTMQTDLESVVQQWLDALIAAREAKPL